MVVSFFSGRKFRSQEHSLVESTQTPTDSQVVREYFPLTHEKPFTGMQIVLQLFAAVFAVTIHI